MFCILHGSKKRELSLFLCLFLKCVLYVRYSSCKNIQYHTTIYFCFVIKIYVSIFDDSSERSVFAIILLKNNDERNKSVSVCFRERIVIHSHILHHF